MLLLRSVVAVLVVIPFITQYITVEKKNNNIVERLSIFVSSLLHCSCFYVVVEFASSIIGQEKNYLSKLDEG